MTRSVFPYYAGDISALVRSLRKEFAACSRAPGHVELLNMLARAAGSRNSQHFRAQAAAQNRLMRRGETPTRLG